MILPGRNRGLVPWGQFSTVPPPPGDEVLPASGAWLNLAGTDRDPVNWTYGARWVTEAWCGMGYDATNGVAWCWGGGHQNYGGNEIYKFDRQARLWARIGEPSDYYGDPFHDDYGGYAGPTTTDGRPAARHTYGSLVYIPPFTMTVAPYTNHSQGILITAHGSLFSGTGYSFFDDDVWKYDIATGVWTRIASYAPSLAPRGRMFSVYNPADGCYYGIHYLGGEMGRLLKYDPKTNVWTSIVDGGGTTNIEGAICLDTTRSRIWSVMNGYTSYVNLDGSAWVDPVATTGATEIEDELGGRANGIAYDPGRDSIIASQGTQALWELDIATSVWTKHLMDLGDDPTQNSPADGGLYSKFQYCPDIGCYLLINLSSDDAALGKLPA
jgi:hypothetical protein